MLTLNDGRSELWQWDTGRTLSVDADCSQLHFSNKVFGRSIDVDVFDGAAIIPDVLLQTDKDLNVWAFVGTAENGYTKISKTFKVNRRNKPADYVFTPPDQTTLAELVGRLDKLEESQDPDAIKNAVNDYLEQNPVESPVQSVNGQIGAVELTAKDVGAISQNDLQAATNEALAQAKASGEFDGADGAPGKNGADGYSPTANVTQNDNGATITITDKNGTTTATVTNGKDGADGIPGKDGADGKDGAPGADGQDGITPTIGDNGNWYLGDTDTGKPSRGADGATGATGATGEKGADGKSAYQYAQDGGYTGTEADFADKMAREYNPDAKTDAMTQAVGLDAAGKLWTEPGSGGGSSSEVWETIIDTELTQDTGEVRFTSDTSGNPFSLKEFKIFVVQPPIDGQTVNNRVEFAPNGNGWGKVGNVPLKPSPKETEQTVYSFIHANTVDGRMNLLTAMVSSNYSSVRGSLVEAQARNHYGGSFCMKVNTDTNKIIYCEMPLTKIGFVGITSTMFGAGTRILLRGIRS